MKHNNFSFLVGEGTKAIFKHGFMSFAAVCITVACLVCYVVAIVAMIIGSFCKATK